MDGEETSRFPFSPHERVCVWKCSYVYAEHKREPSASVIFLNFILLLKIGKIEIMLIRENI
jgi:hypothetical protein